MKFEKEVAKPYFRTAIAKQIARLSLKILGV